MDVRTRRLAKTPLTVFYWQSCRSSLTASFFPLLLPERAIMFGSSWSLICWQTVTFLCFLPAVRWDFNSLYMLAEIEQRHLSFFCCFFFLNKMMCATCLPWLWISNTISLSHSFSLVLVSGAFRDHHSSWRAGFASHLSRLSHRLYTQRRLATNKSVIFSSPTHYQSKALRTYSLHFATKLKLLKLNLAISLVLNLAI